VVLFTFEQLTTEYFFVLTAWDRKAVNNKLLVVSFTENISTDMKYEEPNV